MSHDGELLETGGGLVSTELECPVVSLQDGSPAPPELFASVWRALGDAWRPGEFGVWRERRANPRLLCISSGQAIATDTGPTIELAPSPACSVAGTAKQLMSMLAEVRQALEGLGYAMLGSGVHPTVRAERDDYYRYRTRRPSYDYVIRERGWSHWSILNIASVQEIVDVPFEEAPRALRVMHRFAGLMNLLLRNDPDLLGGYDGRLSVRATAWRRHVPPEAPFVGDAAKVCLPEQEICGWNEYAALLWDQAPMFCVGTKDRGVAWLLDHPSFVRFVLDAPSDGWPARTLSGQPVRVVPERAHLEKSDWTYLGFARIRWKWREDGAEIAAFAEAWRGGRIEPFLAANLDKVVIENRCNSAQPPGDTLVSLFLVAGLLANLDEASELAMSAPWVFWRSLLEASARERLDAVVGGRSVATLAHAMLDVARRGLVRRRETDAATALDPLYARIDENVTPAERLLEQFRAGGVPALLRTVRL